MTLYFSEQTRCGMCTMKKKMCTEKPELIRLFSFVMKLCLVPYICKEVRAMGRRRKSVRSSDDGLSYLAGVGLFILLIYSLFQKVLEWIALHKNEIIIGGICFIILLIIIYLIVIWFQNRNRGNMRPQYKIPPSFTSARPSQNDDRSFVNDQQLNHNEIRLTTVDIQEWNKRQKLREKEQRRQREFAFSGIEQIDKMTGKDFERRMKVLFEMKGWKAELTPDTNDFGADLLVWTPEGKKIVVQCKRHSKNITNKAVQEVVSAKAHYKADATMVITNQWLTKNARILAESTKTEIWDRDRLIMEIEEAEKRFDDNNRTFKA